jgi:hypothetical protein
MLKIMKRFSSLGRSSGLELYFFRVIDGQHDDEAPRRMEV